MINSGIIHSTQPKATLLRQKGCPPIQSMKKLNRLSSQMEPLEARTMMSTSALAVPAALNASAASTNGITLSWQEADASASGYKVLRATNSGKYTQLAQLTSSTATHYTDTNVAPHTAYSYKVEAFTGKVTSPASKPATVAAPLLAPSGLTAVAASGTGVILKWINNDPAAATYTIFRKSDGANFFPIATLSGAAIKTYTDKAIVGGHAYQYEVQAEKLANASAFSAPASTIVPLLAPAKLTAAAASASLVHLSWTNNDAGASGSQILRSTDGTHFLPLATLSTAAANSFDDKTVLPSTIYYYQVQATTAAIASPVSTTATAATPLAAPTWVLPVVIGKDAIQFTWADTDPAVKGFVILQATGTGAFSQVAQIASAKTLAWTDTTFTSNTSYSFKIAALNGSATSAYSTPVNLTTQLLAPTKLTATASAGSSVQLNWINSDVGATQYSILRSTDNITFHNLITLSGASTNSYTDTSAVSAHTYYYQVQALNTLTSSPASNTVTFPVALQAPASLTASVSGTTVTLNWIDKDAQAAGYVVMRSNDGVTFIKLAQLTGSGIQTCTDTTGTTGQKYYYQLQAVNGGYLSAMSNVTNATIPATTPSPAPNPTPTPSTVTIAPAYVNELVITATGTTDTVSISQSGQTLTIVADGQTTTVTSLPSAGLFLYTRGGADVISIDQSVTVQTTVESIDSGVDQISSAGSNVTVWDDSTDIFTGTGTVRSVAAFTGGVAKTAGASLANPKDSGTTMKVNASLWGTGPVAGDINQGYVGDCYFLSSLAAFAGVQPATLEQSAVDMGDGTFTVRYMSGTTPSFVRVSNDIPTYGGGSYVYNRPGSTGNLWATIMEKAYAYFRTGANTYASISSGWMGAVYSSLGVNSNAFFPSSMTESAFFKMVSADLAAGKEVTFGTGSSAPQLVSGHAYTLISASIDKNGMTSYVVRNPWGVSGDSLENGQGYATLTFAQMQANFYDGCQAV